MILRYLSLMEWLAKSGLRLFYSINSPSLATFSTLGHNTPTRAHLKILAVSDMVTDRLYSADLAQRLPDIKLILGCGDLPYEYLEFLVTLMNVPLLYVPGNHDPVYKENNRLTYAEGCEILDLRFKRILGLNIAGIGGSIRYHPHGPNQYSQSEMYFRLASFIPKLMLKLHRNGRKLDVVIAHSPPRGIHDDVDPAHVGFSALHNFIHLMKPHYFLHGHTLSYQHNVIPPVTQVEATTVININPYRILEV